MSRRMQRRNPLMIGDDVYWSSAAYNQRMYQMFREQIINLALSRFKWVGLPKTCDARYLEYTLLFQGVATIAHTKKQPNTYYSTMVAYDSPLNVYDNPTHWLSIGNNGWRFNANTHSGALIWDSMLRIPITNWIDIYSRELVDVWRTKQINRLHQKVPFIIQGDQTKKLDMINIYKQIAGGEPAIIATNGLENMKIDVLKIDSPYLGDELQTEWQNIWNCIYTMLGIDNVPFKAERQVAEEIKSMTMPSSLMALNPLESRRQAIKKLKHIDPITFADLQVVWNEDDDTANYRYDNNVMAQLEHEKGGADGLNTF